ncbi:MAG: hypothetical protein AB1611_08810 [bacterium]
MSTIPHGVELFNIFAETYGKEKAQVIVKDIESMIDSKNQEVATKADIKEIELKIEQVRSSVIKRVAGLMIAYTGVIVAIRTLWK